MVVRQNNADNTAKIRTIVVVVLQEVILASNVGGWGCCGIITPGVKGWWYLRGVGDGG